MGVAAAGSGGAEVATGVGGAGEGLPADVHPAIAMKKRADRTGIPGVMRMGHLDEAMGFFPPVERPP
jgi:hypothetical protein